MRNAGRRAATEREQRVSLGVALVVAPFVLLFVVLLAVKSADSSGSFQIDNRLWGLKWPELFQYSQTALDAGADRKRQIEENMRQGRKK